jgi:hypothetical protein
MIVPTSGHDYKTQNLGPPKPHPAIFTNNHGTSTSPDISKQLNVLKKFINKGNLVVDTAEVSFNNGGFHIRLHHITEGIFILPIRPGSA